MKKPEVVIYTMLWKAFDDMRSLILVRNLRVVHPTYCFGHGHSKTYVTFSETHVINDLILKLCLVTTDWKFSNFIFVLLEVLHALQRVQ